LQEARWHVANVLKCKYNCMPELLRLPLVLHILQTFSISLKAMHLLKPAQYQEEQRVSPELLQAAISDRRWVLIISTNQEEQDRFLSAKARTKRGRFKAKNIKGRLSSVVKHHIFSCKYNCMLEFLGLPLVLHILETFSISLKEMYLLKPIRPKWLIIRRSNVCLQNCCKLRFLTVPEITIITQCSGKLYNFLADKIVRMCPNTSNTVIVTQEDGVVCNHSISLEGLTHYNHERADTQL
jgi:hypothetical protein